MYAIIQQRLALSEKGAKDFIRGTLATTLLDIALMLPAVFMCFLFKRIPEQGIAPGHVH